MSSNGEDKARVVPGASVNHKGYDSELTIAANRDPCANASEDLKARRRYPSRKAAELGISRQRLYQMRQRQAGLCVLCARGAVSRSSFCIVHLLNRREIERRRSQSKPQRLSGRGRKPLVPDP
jgi:hypothetical protein